MGRSRSTWYALHAVGLAAALVMLGAMPIAAAETFVVRSALDDGDDNVGDDVCDAASGLLTVCTLRAAIEEANADPDEDRIEFQIGGADATGIKVIHLDISLEVDRPIVIDGYTQPGASPNTRARGTNAILRVVLDGPGAGTNVHGLWLDAPSEVRGLVIRDFDEGIVSRADGSVVAGNFLGTNAAGTSAQGNFTGISVSGATRVGGAPRAARNLISGNISAITLLPDANGTVIQGNLIGTKANGRQRLGNANGIVAFGAAEVAIGGDTKPKGNVIAFQKNDGISILGLAPDVPSVLIRRNAIFANGKLGIDLAPDGRTPNDDHPPLDAPPPPDTDAGPNELQNFPIITSARTSGGGTTIKGVLRSEPGTSYRLEFFSNPAGDPEGRKFRGSTTVTTDTDGLASWTFKPARRVPLGLRMTATATDLSDDETSEFSRPRTVRAP